ncbi:MAG: NAD-dependent epimerase/dehydratase family protein [Dehalococcoidales bacterium]
MTVVVTGASGHIGINLVRALVAEKRTVRAMVHINHQPIESLGAEIVQGNVTDVESLTRAFSGADVVYHLAGVISIVNNEWPLVEKVNVIGTRNVIEACRRNGVKRLVHFSSIHALEQEPLDTPVDESRPLVEDRSHPPYDRSKAAGQREVRKAAAEGLNAVIVNPTGVFGPYDYQPSFFGAALVSMANGQIPALINGGFNWVDARDVVQGAMLAEKKAPAGAEYLLSGNWVSMQDIAVTIREISDASITGFVCPMPVARFSAPFATVYSRLFKKRPLFTSVSLHALKSNHNISHEKATRELGYQPRPFKETLTDTLKWFEQNGNLKCRLK